MTPKYSSMLFLASALVILMLCLSISSVAADAKWGEPCEERTNNPTKRCERSKAYTCDRQTLRCTCIGGRYSKERESCVAKMDEQCALENSESPFVMCENQHAICDTNRGSGTYGKCVCKPNEDCSSGFTFRPAVSVIFFGLVAAVATFVKMY
jgi:hypothetical protein